MSWASLDKTPDLCGLGFLLVKPESDEQQYPTAAVRIK